MLYIKLREVNMNCRNLTKLSNEKHITIWLLSAWLKCNDNLSNLSAQQSIFQCLNFNIKLKLM